MSRDVPIASTHPARHDALRRLALAVAQPATPGEPAVLLDALAGALGVSLAMVAVHDGADAGSLRPLAARLDGRPHALTAADLRSLPCGDLFAAGLRYRDRGATAGSTMAATGLEACAAYPMRDSHGDPLGLLVVMDRGPIAGGDTEFIETMLQIAAGRLAAQIERERTDEVLRAAALAVSGAGSETVFDELMRLLATTLHVEIAFVARLEPDDPETLHMLARYQDGQAVEGLRYPMAGTPCSTVLGQAYRVVPRGVSQLFPDDLGLAEEALEAYAGMPLNAADGRPLGVLSIVSRRPLQRLERVQAVMQIVAVRAAAELQRLAAGEAMARSEASYRAIFEAAEDAIFIHDWDTGRILDVNGRACESFGWTRQEFSNLSVAEICAGMPPYTVADALRWIQLAKLGRCPPFEWRRRNKDGSLHWDEVRLKPAVIDGQPRVLAFARDITERKAGLAALQAQEQKYRAIFDGSVDSMVLWDQSLHVADVNQAFVQLTGLTREDVVGRHWQDRPDREDMVRLVPLIQAALEGRETRAIELVSRADGSRFDIELRYLPVRMGGARFALGVGRDVTAQREHERELMRSTARLRATVEAAFDAVIGMDGQGRIVEFNAAAERIFGHRRDDVLGQELAEALLPERHRDAHQEGLRNYLSRGHGPMIGRLVETTAMHASGREIPVELAISVAAVPEGSIFVGHLRDITERRHAEQVLRDSEEQYRGIFNAVADALVLRAADFTIVEVNATYEAMSGFSRAEVLGISRVLANPEAVQTKIRALHEQALAGVPVSLETQLVRRDGVRYDLELRGVPILHRGEPHVLYIGRDISQAKQSERALRESEAQYRAMFNATADALILRDENFKAVEVNPAYSQLSGYLRDEVLASTEVLMQEQPALQLRHRLDHARVLAGEPLRFEATARRKDGAVIPVEVRGMPVSYQGRPHVLYALRDLTEPKAAEARRDELERQLRQAQKMEAIGQLTGGIAHDFNNILASVIGYLVLAEERAESMADATLVRQLSQAHLAADRARDLIAQMLAFARRQRGERRVLALAPLLHQTLSLLRATLPSTVTLEVDAPPAAGLEADGGPWVDADPVQLEQVLFNLCINARDAIAGQGRIGVRLRAHDQASTTGVWHCASCRAAAADGPWVQLAIEDDGPGVPADVAERIFDPFFSTKAPGKGSGMGLAMVHGIVHDHGGHLQLETGPDAGSRFSVWLPMSERASTTATVVDARERRTAPLRGRVLVVEDDTMVGDFLAERLAGWGLDARLERDPTAAADWLADPSNAVDVLLTDQTMPRMTGLQLAAQVHAQRAALPIVLVSGNAAAFDPQELARCGVRAALGKPIDGDALRAVLRRLLSAPRMGPASDADAIQAGH